MASFKAWVTGVTEAKTRQLLAYRYEQVSTGKAKTGVVAGLGVTATTPSASGSVVVGIGLGVCQPTTSGGVIEMPNDADTSFDVFTANPMQFVANPRNDIIVQDSATGALSVLVGTPNATPSLGEQAVPTTANPLARLRHLANATTIPSSAIDNLGVPVYTLGGPRVLSSTAKAGKRLHWGAYSGTTNSGGVANFAHGAGFTPSIIQPVQYVISGATTAFQVHYVSGSADGTNFQVQVFNGDGTARSSAITVGFTCIFGE